MECLTAVRLKAWLSVPSIEPAYSGTKVAMIALRLAAVNNAVLLSSHPLDKEGNSHNIISECISLVSSDMVNR